MINVVVASSSSRDGNTAVNIIAVVVEAIHFTGMTTVPTVLLMFMLYLMVVAVFVMAQSTTNSVIIISVMWVPLDVTTR